MKSLLFLVLLSFYLTASATLGGWKKGSFKEDDLYIDGAFRKAFEIYQKDHPNSDIDYTQRLTLYRQVVNGINFKMCFIDLKSDLNEVHEYSINKPPTGNDREIKFNFFEKKSFKSKGEIVQMNDSRFPRIQNTLFGYLKGSGENILFIRKIEVVETSLDNFFIITAQGEKKEHMYVVGQSRDDNDDYEVYGILN